MSERESAFRCPYCLIGTMKQLFVGFRTITNPHWLRPENRLYAPNTDPRCPTGDRVERHAAIEEDEKGYYANYERRRALETGPDPVADDVKDLFDYAAMGYEVPTVAELASEGII